MAFGVRSGPLFDWFDRRYLRRRFECGRSRQGFAFILPLDDILPRFAIVQWMFAALLRQRWAGAGRHRGGCQYKGC